MFFTRTTALAAAAATALSLGAAAPATAMDNDALARLLFGAIATGIIAGAIADSQRTDSHSERNVTINRNYYHHTRPSAPRQTGRTVEVTRPYGKTTVPASCERELRTQNGLRGFVGQPCLERSGYSTSRLPRACQRTLDFGHREIKAWGTACLENSGYRLR